MTGDWDDPLDPSNPFVAFFWSAWHCPTCAEDGGKDELVDGRCPHCASDFDLI